MALRVAIKHKTVYKYDRPVSLSPHTFRLRPAPHCRTPIEAYSIKIQPEEQFFNWQQDPFGNYQARLVFPEKTTELVVDVEVIAEMKTINPFDFFVDEKAEHYPFEYGELLKKELMPYLEIDDDSELLDNWMEELEMPTKEMTTVDFLVAINAKLNQELNYTIRMEPGVQDCQTTLDKKLGSCRDFAWLFVQIARRLGLAARFVSGYLVQLTADVKSLDGPSGPEADFTDLHAWTEIYVPGAGWIGLDATSGLFAGEGHIPLACTPQPESAAPVTGMTDKCEVTFEFENSVTRIYETPRVTKPYSEKQWDDIVKLGDLVDKHLVEGDVRLTMGGEPTFVSIDDMDSAQWNTKADGKHKRQLSHNLALNLRKTMSPGSLLHYGQGKWYPGEELPRWEIGLYWRKDGKPTWRKPELIADPTKDYGYTHKDAKLFIDTMCEFLGISNQNISPAYEDAFYFLWEESKLPLDVDPLKYNLKDPLERRTLTDRLKRGLDEPKGYVLPLNMGFTKWITCRWDFRRQHLYLNPGNSPIGLRLPLDSVLYAPQVELEEQFEPDLFAAHPALDDYHNKVKERARIQTQKTSPTNSYSEFVKQALCVEERDGCIYIFLPPVKRTEAYLDLIASIEMAAEKLSMPVVIEGYPAPEDIRLEKMKITPDPGVIEVNIHPSAGWREMVDKTTLLYEQAYLSRLGTEKFMLDGRHTGSGGGNHVTIGGATPPDSPLLRRPDLLRSLITYWQHHPGLSYLFSGAFIGPTSQAPRVDEGRLENLYELEIAFSQIPEKGDVPFWLVDRILRHMLTDITGNTHRAEFCIDKLYSPDSASGRLGILELRAFEMPPHAQMSLVQLLLVRTLIAKFWKQPYKGKLVRWGTELHDRYLLEHYVKQDLADVVQDLNDAGYDFSLSWFEPFFEFRFPHYGTVNIKGMEMELRMAIEPWHVLGEEVTAQGTSRYVDSSVERVQLKVKGLNSSRYIIACNGCRMKMRQTNLKDEYVIGIRYKAWQPWSAMHPTVGIDTPLVFDVIDTWNNKSVGGFTYYVSHPGGRGYDTFPVNSYEAEARRGNRFWDIGHTQEVLTPTYARNAASTVEVLEHERDATITYFDVPENNDYPNTLDLRQRWTQK